VLANQKKIVGNQGKLDAVIANQRAILGNQKKILAKK
jgi:3-methyladenine DNA glycosylase Tag